MKGRVFLLLLFAAVIVSAYAEETDRQACGDVPEKTLAENEMLFAYSIEGKLDALATFDGRAFLPADGREFKTIDSMVDFRDQKRYPVSFNAYWTELGKDRCIWFAGLPDGGPDSMSIFSSRESDLDTKPDPEVVELFYAVNKDCIGRGDPPEGDKIPCIKPELLATSDLNANGRLEFWYSQPYIWDTGFKIAELSESGDRLDVLSSKCLDCD